MQTESNSQKHLKDNHLPKPESKVPSTTESREEGHNTVPDPKLKKEVPNKYQKKVSMTLIKSNIHKEKNW